jgi:hypothetical protein
MGKTEKITNLSFTYDRLWEQKLSQVYQLLVPDPPAAAAPPSSHVRKPQKHLYMKTAAIYARASSEGQKENKTIGSKVDELIQFAQEQGYVVPEPYIFKDEGYSGAILIRPGLEKVRDLSDAS